MHPTYKRYNHRFIFGEKMHPFLGNDGLITPQDLFGLKISEVGSILDQDGSWYGLSAGFESSKESFKGTFWTIFKEEGVTSRLMNMIGVEDPIDLVGRKLTNLPRLAIRTERQIVWDFHPYINGTKVRPISCPDMFYAVDSVLKKDGRFDEPYTCKSFTGLCSFWPMNDAPTTTHLNGLISKRGIGLYSGLPYRSEPEVFIGSGAIGQGGLHHCVGYDESKVSLPTWERDTKVLEGRLKYVESTIELVKRIDFDKSKFNFLGDFNSAFDAVDTVFAEQNEVYYQAEHQLDVLANQKHEKYIKVEYNSI